MITLDLEFTVLTWASQVTLFKEKQMLVRCWYTDFPLFEMEINPIFKRDLNKFYIYLFKLKCEVS